MSMLGGVRLKIKSVCLGAAIVCLLLLSGCGIQGDTRALIDLPVSVQSHLSPLSKRTTLVHQLPTKTSARTILYVSPSEKYAIDQFRSVWTQLSTKPAVVWTGTNEATAQSAWTREGFTTDPLPSTVTSYVTTSLATPDAYAEQSRNSWAEIPGILPASETAQWVSFFTH